MLNPCQAEPSSQGGRDEEVSTLLLRRVHELSGIRLHATDGDAGHLHDVYLDDRDWRIRYFHVDTRRWLPGRHVLLAPAVVHGADWDRGRIDIAITREQLRTSPDIDSHKPVSRQHEMALYDYFQWPLASESVWEGEELAARLHNLLSEWRGPTMALPLEELTDDPHLWSARALRPYGVDGDNGELGRVVDLLVDPNSWEIPYLVIENRGPLHRYRFLVSVNTVRAISWETRRVRIALGDETNGDSSAARGADR